MARYNVERYCNDMDLVKPLDNFRENIPEGYFPKIMRSVNNRTYAGRHEGATLKDIARGDLQVSVGDMERWRDRIYAAIDAGFIYDVKLFVGPLYENFIQLICFVGPW